MVALRAPFSLLFGIEEMHSNQEYWRAKWAAPRSKVNFEIPNSTFQKTLCIAEWFSHCRIHSVLNVCIISFLLTLKPLPFISHKLVLKTINYCKKSFYGQACRYKTVQSDAKTPQTMKIKNLPSINMAVFIAGHVPVIVSTPVRDERALVRTQLHQEKEESASMRL